MRLRLVGEESGEDRSLVGKGRGMAFCTVAVIGWSYGVYRQFPFFSVYSFHFPIINHSRLFPPFWDVPNLRNLPQL